MVTERFSLTGGQILTYDCYTERTTGDSKVSGYMGESQAIAYDAR